MPASHLGVRRRYARRRLSAEVTFLLNAGARFAPDAISHPVLWRCHKTRAGWGPRTAQVDPLPPVDLITARGPTRKLRASLQAIVTGQPLNSPSSFTGHLILDRKTKTRKTLMEMRCLGHMSKRQLAPTVSSCFTASAQLSRNPYGQLLVLVAVQGTICSP